MTDGRIRTEVMEGGVALITIDRPAKRNALTAAMIADLVEAFRRCENDDDVRCVVLTGEGEAAFCAGHDLAEVSRQGSLGHLYEEAHMQVFLAPRHATKPVIAAVNGAAYAGGFCLALNSDLRVATPEATFAIPAAKLGVVPIAGQSARLPHMLPPAVVAEMVLLARPLLADRAHQLGFVNAVAPAAELREEALAMARHVAELSAVSIRSFKRILHAALYEGVPAADRMEYWLAMAAAQQPDLAEGLSAFAERRKPVFGRRGSAH